MDKALLINLHQYPEFERLLIELAKMRPIVPAYDPKLNNIEEMKFHSTRQQMFDSIMIVIDPFKRIK